MTAEGRWFESRMVASCLCVPFSPFFSLSAPCNLVTSVKTCTMMIEGRLSNREDSFICIQRAAAAAAASLCVAILLLLLQKQCCCFLLLFVIVCRMAKLVVGSSNLIPLFACFLFVQTRLIFNVPLGSTAAFMASICLRVHTR